MSVFILPNGKVHQDELCTNFIKWLLAAQPGEKFCYCIDHHVAGKSIARTAYQAYENGEVILFQKKEGKKYGYWAQKRNKWGNEY